MSHLAKLLELAVDAHMHRIFNDIKWVNSNTPKQTREQFEKWLRQERWIEVKMRCVALVKSHNNRKKKWSPVDLSGHWICSRKSACMSQKKEWNTARRMILKMCTMPYNAISNKEWLLSELIIDTQYIGGCDNYKAFHAVSHQAKCFQNYSYEQSQDYKRHCQCKSYKIMHRLIFPHRNHWVRFLSESLCWQDSVMSGDYILYTGFGSQPWLGYCRQYFSWNHSNSRLSRIVRTSLSGREAVLSCLYGRSWPVGSYWSILSIATCRSYYQCGAWVYYASSLCYFSRVLFHNFTITNIHPTTKAFWGVVWETNLLLLRVSLIKSPRSLVALVLPVVSHFQLLYVSNAHQPNFRIVRSLDPMILSVMGPPARREWAPIISVMMSLSCSLSVLRLCVQLLLLFLSLRWAMCCLWNHHKWYFHRCLCWKGCNALV